MSTLNSKLLGATLVALVVLVLAGCGSDDGPETLVRTLPPIERSSAERLAKMSDEVASDLDAGDTCSAAIAADELAGAVDDAQLPSYLRSSVEETATRLVNEVNCPPPPEPKKKKKEEKKDEHGDGNKGPGGDGDYGTATLPGSGGLPPGQAKKRGQ
jgi:hypothetical protein